VRTLDEDVRLFMEKRLMEVVEGTAATFGAKAEISYRHGYPVTVNTATETARAAAAARDVAGDDRVSDTADGTMGGEDFAYMLQKRPGAYIFLGNGPSSELHSDTYDFNDEIIPLGVSYWVRLVETGLPAT
jgi:hippurate hydrolase